MNPIPIVRGSALAGLAALLFASAGCQPEERMTWSPDGSRAAVLRPDGLVLMDAKGACSASVATNVASAAWMPDGRSLLLTRIHTVTNWTSLAALLPDGERQTVESFARALPDMLRGALMATGGDMDAAMERFGHLSDSPEGARFIAAALCLRDTRRDALSAALEGARNREDILAELDKEIEVKVHELCRWPLDGDPAAARPTVVDRSLQSIESIRIAPGGARAAGVWGDALTVLPLDGGTGRLSVATHVAGRFDWTPDGKALVYAAAGEGSDAASKISLVQLLLCPIGTSSNGLPEAGGIRPLGMAACPFAPCLRCLPDGRVLFASLALSLPGGATASGEARFYVVDPAEAGAVPKAIPSPAGALPQELASFVPSPDGRRIAVVESGADTVALVNVATGALEVVSPPRKAGKCRTLPAWRGPGELYYAALPVEGAARAEWMRWRAGAPAEPVSRAWPDAALSNLFER